MILKRRFRIFYERFISLKGDPSQIAAGLAIGVFVGVTPTIPLHTAITFSSGNIFVLCFPPIENAINSICGS